MYDRHMEENMIFVFWLALIILFFVAGRKIYAKAGKPGRASIIPIYNAYTWMQIAGRK